MCFQMNFGRECALACPSRLGSRALPALLRLRLPAEPSDRKTGALKSPSVSLGRDHVTGSVTISHTMLRDQSLDHARRATTQGAMPLGSSGMERTTCMRRSRTKENAPSSERPNVTTNHHTPKVFILIIFSIHFVFTVPSSFVILPHEPWLL